MSSSKVCAHGAYNLDGSCCTCGKAGARHEMHPEQPPDDSPPFTPDALRDFAAREFVRENRRATETEAATVAAIVAWLRREAARDEAMADDGSLGNGYRYAIALRDAAHAIERGEWRK